jgi:hypothetical protein
MKFAWQVLVNTRNTEFSHAITLCKNEYKFKQFASNYRVRDKHNWHTSGEGLLLLLWFFIILVLHPYTVKYMIICIIIYNMIIYYIYMINDLKSQNLYHKHETEK